MQPGTLCAIDACFIKAIGRTKPLNRGGKENRLKPRHTLQCQPSRKTASLKLTGPILASELTWGPLNPVFFELGLFDWRLPELSELVGRAQYSFFPDYAFFSGQESPISVLCLWFMPEVVLVLQATADEGKFERIGLLHLYLEDGVALTSEELRQRRGTIELV